MLCSRWRVALYKLQRHVLKFGVDLRMNLCHKLDLSEPYLVHDMFQKPVLPTHIYNLKNSFIFICKFVKRCNPKHRCDYITITPKFVRPAGFVNAVVAIEFAVLPAGMIIDASAIATSNEQSSGPVASCLNTIK